MHLLNLMYSVYLFPLVKLTQSQWLNDNGTSEFHHFFYYPIAFSIFFKNFSLSLPSQKSVYLKEYFRVHMGLSSFSLTRLNILWWNREIV